MGATTLLSSDHLNWKRYQPMSDLTVPHQVQRASLAADPHRPRFHLCAPTGWMNDPDGLIQWRGTYHVFYQHNPMGGYHANVHWGHAASADLITWHDLPIAISPTPGGPDADGCWSGSIIDADGTAKLFYTSVYPQSQSCATPLDADLITWAKHPANPLISGIPEGVPVVGGAATPDIRDPWLWREGDVWLMALGSGIEGQGGAVLLYESPDLVTWRYLHPLHSGTMGGEATIWECPNFFPLGDEHVLIVSQLPAANSVHYQLGAYADRRFTPRTTATIDGGTCFYAPQTLLDDAGRRLMWGWLKEERTHDAHRAAGWAGALTMPRVLSIAGGRLRQTPAPELAGLRQSLLFDGRVTLAPGEKQVLASHARHAEIVITAPRIGSFTVGVLSNPDGSEEVLIDYDEDYATLLVSTTHASLSDTAQGQAITAPFVPEGEMITLRVFVDGSVVEVFADDTLVVSARAYPTKAESTALVMYATGPAVSVTCQAWAMRDLFSRPTS